MHLDTDLLTVTVRLDPREDGGLRVSSTTLRGLHLAGADRDRVWDMIAPAITLLLERNHGVKVASVRPTRTLEEACAKLPGDLDLHVEAERVFVVELLAA